MLENPANDIHVNTSLANPAAVKCNELNGTYNLENSNCEFGGGVTICDSWELLRTGKCQAGDTKVFDAAGAGWTMFEKIGERIPFFPFIFIGVVVIIAGLLARRKPKFIIPLYLIILALLLLIYCSKNDLLGGVIAGSVVIILALTYLVRNFMGKLKR